MIAPSLSSAPTRSDCETTIPPSEVTATSEVPPPTSTTIEPVGSPTGSPAPIAAAIGSSMRYAVRAPADRQASSTAHFSTPVTPDGTHTTTRGCAQRFWCTFWMKCRSICSVTSKSAMTPSLSGRMAWIVPGVRPSMRLASMPTACTSAVLASIATTDGSDRTIPRPRTYTSVFAVPRSTAMSRPPKPVRYEKNPIYRKPWRRLDKPGRRMHKWLRVLRNTPWPTLAGVFQHPNEFGHREPDHVPEIALDSVHQGRPDSLDRIATGPVAPLSGGQVCIDLARFERAEADLCHADAGLLLAAAAQDQAAVDLVRASRQTLEEDPRLHLVRRFAEDLAVQD